MVVATNDEYLGFLPLVSYQYPWELLAERRYFGSNAQLQIWKPAYAVWSVSIKKRDGKVVDGVLEMGGMAQMLYDFCGGVLTSSPYVSVFEVPEFSAGDVWAKNWRRGWSAYTLGTEFPPADRSKSQVQNEEERQTLFTQLPDSETYIGPGPFTVAELRAIGARSIFGYLAHYAAGCQRRGIFGADRFTRDTELRDVLKLGSRNLTGWWTNLPRVGFRKSTSGTHIKAHVAGTGNRDDFQYCGDPGIYSAGRSYRNANSGSQVSMAGAILPDVWRGWYQPAESTVRAVKGCSVAEWRKMGTEWYAGLMPLDMFHNG